ncbi:hypothetical protein [Burkholderia multivorans]|uniref:hypothetical protein n=1 Tax=Burkholderia multivorans TaxID=87883 RepID=UPI00015FDA2A|nr:hypothetical protein [Burkholderia multivorans]ABX15488.1 hypothetical protein Bmul_1800 [Burkholderia multivorans ATCC 17616]
MQNFIDSKTAKIYAFEDDVQVDCDAGVYSFRSATGEVLGVPGTLQPYQVPAPSAIQIAANKAAAAWRAWQASNSTSDFTAYLQAVDALEKVSTS